LQVLRRDLARAVQKKRPGTSLSDYLLHQDNAPAHVSQMTRLEMVLMDLEMVAHPPYSPDLAPMDFSIFPQVIICSSILV
jgi:histone-lysine N-methyltransferase SETMAR